MLKNILDVVSFSGGILGFVITFVAVCFWSTLLIMLITASCYHYGCPTAAKGRATQEPALARQYETVEAYTASLEAERQGKELLRCRNLEWASLPEFEVRLSEFKSLFRSKKNLANYFCSF